MFDELRIGFNNYLKNIFIQYIKEKEKNLNNFLINP
jgi:hypothetical protein